ncbi:TraB/GumN family protein [Adhaeribacter rhizoryzae]|uniref:TraB/GumN family protein n=1 Tax=Adhaeribacter rhizoryzae TaxID=2607907 RepID=A0A5M6DS88_9BACT|nr:TraB/GumN family protein [Adhaeribacter rhizoryzae]KAA5549040.1 TraB/GumN family protein [Adhaeribacter rhizoryzae]
MQRVLLVFTLVLVASVLQAQNMPKTILWKVSKPGSKNESFLFGTFHEVSPFFFNSLPNAVSKLQQSNILFVEERMAAAKALLPEEQPLWNYNRWKKTLSQAQAQIFTDFVNKAEDSSYYKLDPLLLTLTTSRLYLTNFCNTDPVLSELMDHYIEKLAIKQQKQIYSLDGNQNAMLHQEAKRFSAPEDSMYATYAIHFMKSMLNNDTTSCQIVSAYKKFDLNYELNLDITRSASHSPLLIERNTKWTQILDKAFAANNCFVAVGVRHLFYKQGLIQQLRTLGYQVTPVPTAQ